MRQGAIYLTYDGRNTHHHAKGEITIYHLDGYPTRDKDVAQLAYKRETCFLHLSQAQHFLAHAVLTFLQLTPFIQLICLVSIELDVGNALQQFELLVLIFTTHLELLIVECLATAEEVGHPHGAESRQQQIST